MKFLSIISVLLLLSCQASVKKENLIGSWTTIETAKASKDALTDIITFEKDGDIYIEYLLNGSVIEKIKGKYSIEGQTLIASYDTSEIRFRIHELSKKFFTARQDGAKALVRMRKID